MQAIQVEPVSHPALLFLPFIFCIFFTMARCSSAWSPAPALPSLISGHLDLFSDESHTEYEGTWLSFPYY